MKRLLYHIRRRYLWHWIRNWRKRAGERGTLLLLALFTGTAASLAAAVLHLLVKSLESLCNSWQLDKTFSLTENPWFILFFFTPLIGMALSYCVQRFFGGARYAKSLSPLILALHLDKTFIPLKEVWTHVLSSGLAVGLGGSAGLEAPSVLTGAAIGANTGSRIHLARRHRQLLIGCGAAAAISAIFNSPIGGVLFAVEVLLPEFSVAALVPMLLASAVATVFSRLLFDHTAPMLEISANWRTDAVPFYLLCALFSALVGCYVIRNAYKLGSFMRRTFPNSKVRLAAGGSMLCLILLIFPTLRGQGYKYIVDIFNGHSESLIEASPLLSELGSGPLTLTLIVAAGILLKVIASVFTVESGGDGGIFAPSMYIGAFTGFAFARIVNLTGIIELQEPNFVVAGMCGVFTAVMRAPLTGVFLIAEVTGGYLLLVPLMISSAGAWFFARKFEPESIYRKVLVESKLIMRERDKAMLQKLPVRLNLERDFPVLHINDTPAKIGAILEKKGGAREIFPVLDDNGVLQGVVQLEKILAAMLNPDLSSSLLVFDLMETPRGMVSVDDDLAWAITNLERYDLKYLPALDKDGKFAGFVSRNQIFLRCRQLIRDADTF